MFSLCTDFLFDIMFVCHSPSTSYASQYWSVSLRSRSWTSKSWSCSWSWSSVRKIWIQRCSLPPKICFKGLRKVCGVQKWYGHALSTCEVWWWSASASGRRRRPPSIVGTRKLVFCYLTVRTAWSYLYSSGYSTSVWQTDGHTDGIAVAITALCIASNAAALKHRSRNATVIVVNKWFNFYSTAALLTRQSAVILTAIPSVCPSVTLWYPIQKNEDRIMWS